MSEPETANPKDENKYHTYRSHDIPWFVHLLWITFWLCAIAYMVHYALPLVGPEVANPP